MIQHVYPLDDIRIHIRKIYQKKGGENACQCPCEPMIEINGEDIIVIHNSFDGREGVEWANEILNSDKTDL